jgi:hypothetical protein
MKKKTEVNNDNFINVKMTKVKMIRLQKQGNIFLFNHD